MQSAAAEPKLKQRSTPSFSLGREVHARGVDADAGASAGMPNFLQRKSNGGDKSHSTGMDSSEEERQRLLDEEKLPAPIQKKLVIGAADDPLEHEADRVAQTAAQRSTNQVANVQRKPDDQETCPCGGSCDACAAKEKLQRSSDRSSSSASAPAAPAHLPSSEGAPLSGQVRQRVEPVLGADLSGVRVHSGPQAASSARALNARAYTHQNHIWLGPSQSVEDVELIAHEATHVVQQRAAPSRDGLVQRRPEDYEHPEDGATVQQNMGEQVANATDGNDDGGGDAADSGADTESATTSAEARSAAQTVSPEEREEKKGELEPYSKPPVDRPAAAQPQVASAAGEVKSEADQPSEPLAEGQEKTPASGEKGAAAQADDAAALGAAAFAQAAAETMPDTPASVLPPAPIAPVNAEGEMVQPDPAADDAAAQLATEVQRMRNEGLIARQRATGLRANADRLRGNLRIARGATDTAEQGLTKAQGHVESRREIASQARDALAVSEEKAASVAAQAPEYANRATQTHEDSGPMATEAQAKAGESGANSPDDEEAAGKMQEASGQMSQVGSDATSVDNAVTGTQAKGEALMADAAQAQEKNTATAGKLDATDEAIEQTDARLTELDAQNEAARARIAGVEQGPAQLNAGAAGVDTQAVAVLTASDDLEEQIHSAQDEFDSDMRGIPGSKAVAAVAEQGSPAGVVQRDAESAYGDRERVDVLGMFRGPASAAEREEQAQRAQRAAERRRQRLLEINERANGHFENLSATDKMGIALDIMGENLMGDLGNARWPHILGQMALAFVDPLVSLEGVVSGLNMTLSGAANLLSLEQWSRDPLGNLLKSSADIATGLTIILGSIAGLCTAILVILGALAIITFGAMGPAFAAASAFLGPIITTVGGWAISCAAIAAELQFYVLIKNLVDAATATTAEGLEHESDQMTEDATQAAGMAAQVVTAGVMEAGGAALAETAVGQRLGAMATSVGERFDMIPPPRGAPVLEPGVTTPPETPPVVTGETSTVPPEASPPSAPAADVPPASAAPAAPEGPAPAAADAPAAAQPTSTAPSEPPAAASTSEVAPATSADAPAAPADSPAPASTPAAESPTPAADLPEPPQSEPRPSPAASDPAPPEPTPPQSEPPTAAGETEPPASTPDERPAESPEPATETPAATGDAAAEAARAKLDEHLENMLDNDISPEDLGFTGREWEQFQRDYAANPERALADLERRLDTAGLRAGGMGSPEDAAGDVASHADDVRDQAHPRTSESTSGPERERAAAEAEDRGPHPDDMRGNEADIGSTVPDEVPEGDLFDPLESGEPVTPDRARDAYMGSTPGKYSETGAAVVERMRSQGLIRGEGPLLPGNPNGLEVLAPDGTWHLIDENIDMSHHPVDAVTYWNEEGRYYGARSEAVRDFMTDPNNYILEPGGPNQLRGAQSGDRYLPPEQ